MKKTKLTRSLLAACSIVALSAVMYGCIHGGDDPAPEPMTTPEPPTPEDVDMSGVDADAMATAGTYMIDAGGTHTAGDVTFSCAAGGDACSVTVAADGSATSTGGMVMAATSQAFMDRAQIAMLQGQINDLRAQLGLDPDDSLSDSITQLQSDRADLQKQVDDAQDEKDKMAAEAAAKDAVALFDGITETTTNLTVEVTAVADKHGGGMASITATGLTPGVGMHDDLMKSAEPMLGDDWQGTMLTRAIPAVPATATNAGTSSTVVVYTDIDAPKAVPFGDVYTLDANGNLAVAAATDAAAHTGLISATAFDHTGRMVHDPDEDDTNETIRIRGMLNGATGEFRCSEGGTAGACASIESSAGVRLMGTWVFDPDSGAMAMMADPHFAYFGWWLNKGTTEGVEAGVFHGVTDAAAAADQTLANPAAADFTLLGGTATYSGSAAGKYALNPSLSSASGGHWTADATLTADFGTEATNGTISGMVENFMAGGEEMNWSVALGATALTETGGFDSATGDPATGDGAVWTVDGVAGAESGAWSGQLRGPGDNNVPTVATGMFSATHQTGDTTNVGQMIGAFGAHLDE